MRQYAVRSGVTSAVDMNAVGATAQPRPPAGGMKCERSEVPQVGASPSPIKVSPSSGMVNACKQCAPLGACIAFKGIEGMLPMLHGSQGCATYIRRYLISHYRETMDIASSNFSETTTIFGGNRNFNVGIDNIISQYHPLSIGIASTCLSETIGEDVSRLIAEYRELHRDSPTLPAMFFASTPSYSGTHYDGFHEAVSAAVRALAVRSDEPVGKHMNLFSNFITPADIRLLKDIVLSYGIDTMIFPDYSDTLDGGNWSVYHRIPPGGTSLSALRHSAMALLSIELGYILNSGVSNSRIRRRAVQSQSAGEYLRDTFDVVCRRVGLPIGIEESDRFFSLLSEVSGRPVPVRYTSERSRLVDLYIDGHKYVSMKRVVIYGEEDLVIGLASFAVEVGLIPVLCASGGESGRLELELRRLLGDRYPADMIVSEGMSFDALEAAIYKHSLCPDLMLGNSKGYYISRSLGIPLIRVGFPIHDRIGASHQSILCYSGTSYLLESIINALITARQSSAKIDYKYM